MLTDIFGNVFSFFSGLSGFSGFSTSTDRHPRPIEDMDIYGLSPPIQHVIDTFDSPMQSSCIDFPQFTSIDSTSDFCGGISGMSTGIGCSGIDSSW